MNFHDPRLPDRFWEKCIPEPNSGCWLWLGNHSANGYGSFSLHSTTWAHRASYVGLVGPIPKGFSIDHLCRTRCCVNPAHLEAVTPRENNLRGMSPMAENARRTHCKHGHELAGSNLVVDHRGLRRRCKVCRLSHMRTWHARDRERKAFAASTPVPLVTTRQPDDDARDK